MEAAVATATAPPEPEPQHDGEAEATRSTEELFQWSGYVHVGRGADTCEHGVDGACTDSAHFHAWVCLPNTYQIRDITDKARAARARKTRALRDPESDSYAILESELDALRLPQTYKQLVDAIARRNVENGLVDMLDDLQSDDRFTHHAQDAEEFRRLEALPEGERDAEEYKRLQEDMLAYGTELQKEMDERTKTELAHLEQMSQEDVIELERKFRIEDISAEVYLHSYYTWAIFTGTREPTLEGFPSQRKFKDPSALTAAAPEVIVALREKIRTLENRISDRGDAAGNS